MIGHIEAEMSILKGMLREQGLPTQGILMDEFRKRPIEDEKKLFTAREKAKNRVKELSWHFPHAFGVKSRREFENEFVQEILSRGRPARAA